MGTSAMMVDTSSTALLSLAIFWQSFGKCVPVSMKWRRSKQLMAIRVRYKMCYHKDQDNTMLFFTIVAGPHAQCPSARRYKHILTNDIGNGW